jgi:signal transduction histidine kinase
MLSSIRLRLAATSALWLAAALIAAGLSMVGLFQSHATAQFDLELFGLIDEMAALSDIGPDGNPTLSRPHSDPRFNRAFSGWYWIIKPENGRPSRSRSLWDADLALPAPLPPDSFETQGPKGEKLRVLARQLTLPGSGRPVLFLVAGPREHIDAAGRGFAAHTALAFVLLGGGLILVVLAQITWGLRPLGHIRRALAAIRAGRSRQLDGQFPAEVQPLADEMNRLIVHNQEALERTRTHIGNLAHALKTPLAALQNEVDALPRDQSQSLRGHLETLTTGIDHHLKRARMAGASGLIGQRTDVAEVAEGIIRTLGRIHSGRRLHATLEGQRGLFFQGERQDLEEMLGNLIENAFKWAKGRVRVVMAGQPDGLAITVEDDGPGIPEADRARVLERGLKLDERMPGAGLGLAIAADLAALYQGTVSLGGAALGGLSCRLELPRAASADS